ncbi:MAG TPA: hypothetical protein GX697_01035 [Firmicutes bacterium]|nr:hypothetical protein [Bacillota bacterium]
MTGEKSFQAINERIKAGKAVVLTAEEVIPLVEAEGLEEAARQVDVVTTGTFGPMCSSGAFLNLGHPKPRMRFSRVYLNGVNAYTGIAAVDVYLGATEIPENDPANQNYPGEFNYGGAHVIEDLLAGKEVHLEASSYGTDCYPRRHIDTWITLDDINEAYLYNPRNCYQNYNVGVNLSNKTIYTYMGILKGELGNANYSTSGQLSPLLKDPFFRTIGMGTRVFLGGGIGYVAWYGTQHNPCVARTKKGAPRTPGGTLALIGDLKLMSPRWIRGISYLGYGVSMQVGVGIPIPILNPEILAYAALKDEDLVAPIMDYSEDYPQGTGRVLGEVSYAQLKTGEIEVLGKKVPAAPLSSYPGAREIAAILKEWILAGDFLLTEPVFPLPSADSGIKLKPLTIRRKEAES